MSLTEGMKKNLIKESDLDGHLRKTLMGRFELGMFDPADMLPWAKLGSEVISSEKNNDMAVQAARESMVLLENKGNVLPLSKSIKTLAVLGPNAAARLPTITSTRCWRASRMLFLVRRSYTIRLAS